MYGWDLKYNHSPTLVQVVKVSTLVGFTKWVRYTVHHSLVTALFLTILFVYFFPQFNVPYIFLCHKLMYGWDLKYTHSLSLAQLVNLIQYAFTNGQDYFYKWQGLHHCCQCTFMGGHSNIKCQFWVFFLPFFSFFHFFRSPFSYKMLFPLCVYFHNPHCKFEVMCYIECTYFTCSVISSK